MGEGIKITKADGTDITQDIEEILKGFLENLFNNIRRLTLDKLTPNPLLMKLIGETAEYRTASEVVEYLIATRIERSATTSFGNTIQKIATAFSDTTGVEGADIQLDKQEDDRKVRWYIQIKSGPSTVNKDICKETSRELQSATRRDPGSAGLLAITYGRESDVSSVTHNYLDFDFKAGREFWEFVSGDSECYKQLWKLTIQVAENYSDSSGKNLKQLIEDKRKELTEEFKKRYGESGEEMWEKFLEDNM